MKKQLVLLPGYFDPVCLETEVLVNRIFKLFPSGKLILLPFDFTFDLNGASLEKRLKMLSQAFSKWNSIEIKNLKSAGDFASFFKNLNKIYSGINSETTIYLMLPIGLYFIEKFCSAISELDSSFVIYWYGDYFPTHCFPLTIEHRILLDSCLLFEEMRIRSLKKVTCRPDVIDFILHNDLYFVPKVKSYYSNKRYDHAVSVAKLSYKIALANNLDPSKAFIAGYLHDIAKQFAKTEDGVKAMREKFPRYKNYPDWSYHQFLGKEIAHSLFGIEDKDILNAIEFHTTGCGKMGPYSKIIYCADKLDPLRGWDSEEYISACLEDIDEGFIKELKHNTDYLDELNPGEVKDILTSACIKKYLGDKTWLKS